MTRVTIGIASIGRPSLADTLKSLADQELGDDLSMDIVIADDSGGSSVTDIVRSLELDIDVRIIPAGMRNVAVARNACLDHARGDVMLFIDDDEIAPPDWVDKLARQMIETGADCLFAPVNPVYRDTAPAWLLQLSPLYPDEVRTGRRDDRVVGRTGNSAIRLDFIRSNAIRFDPNYAMHGEDLFFFTECANSGADMRAVSHPVLDEHVRDECYDLGYVCKALYGRGRVYADVRCRMSEARTRTTIRLFLSSAVGAALASLALPFTVLAGRTMMARALFRLSLDTGKLARLIGGPANRDDAASRNEAVAAPERSRPSDDLRRDTALRSADKRAG